MGPRQGGTGRSTTRRAAFALLVGLLVSSAAGAQDGEPPDGGVPEPAAASAAEPGDEADAGTRFEEIPPVPDGSRTLPAVPEGQPTPVHIGVLPTLIHDVDLKSGTATVTYWLWIRWRGDADVNRIEVVNGTLEASEHGERYESEGAHYYYARYRAKVQVSVDFHAFPFDRHEIVLAFEHISLDETFMHFVVDAPALTHVESPEISGWTMERPRFEVTRHAYRSNFGSPFTPVGDDARYERFHVRIGIRHAPLSAFAKTFLPLLISVLITSLLFWVDPADSSTRVSLGVAGTFGAVTSQMLVAGALPDIGYLTLSDKVHVAGLVFIFFALLESVAVGLAIRAGHAERAKRVDRWAMVGSYVAFTGYFVALVALP